MLGWWVAAATLVVAVISCGRLLGRLEAIARATHELRAPLCAARLAGHAGALDGVDQALARAGLALDDLEAARSGRLGRSRSGAVDPGELLERVRRQWAPLAWPTGRELRVVSAGGIAALRGDDRRLAQALGTLVANALEHGDGPVLLSARSWAGRVRLEVADAGAGPRRSLTRLARGRRGGRGARGRGLAIAARIAREHGGRIMREPGSGCRIVLDLPAGGAPCPSVDTVRTPLSGNRPSSDAVPRPFADTVRTLLSGDQPLAHAVPRPSSAVGAQADALLASPMIARVRR